MKSIKGSGGGSSKGGGGSTAAYEAPNTLRSRAIARIAELLCEGEIEGFVDAANPSKSIFFNNVVLQNADGSFNFGGVALDYRLGLPYASQSNLEGFSDQETQFAVAEAVVNATPVARSLSGSNIDRVRVTVEIPQLTKFDADDGSLRGSMVEFEIELQLTGAGSWQRAYTVDQWRARTAQPPPTGIHRVTMDVKPTQTASVFGWRDWVVDINYREVGGGSWLPLFDDSGTVRRVYDNATYDTGTGESGTGGFVNDESFRVHFDTGDDFFDPTKYYEFQAVEGSIGTYKIKGGMSQRISGKTVSPYYITYDFALPVPASIYDIRVRRVSNDQVDTKIRNDVNFFSYTEVISEKLSYPDSAVVGLTIDSEGFEGRVPKRAYELLGLKTPLPDNYNPVTRVYTGMWGGSFDTEWHNNPAWVLYDLLTNARYGLGEALGATDVDAAALYTISQYNDGLVHKGLATLTAGEFVVGTSYEIETAGSTNFVSIGAADSNVGTQFVATGVGSGTGTAFEIEPRFTFNGVLGKQEDAYHTLNAVASSMRVMLYWSAGSVSFVQDSPRTTDVIVGRANVISGEFNYSSIGLKARHNVVLVTWNDPDNFYKPTVEVVELPDQIAKFGWNQTDIRAFGCTSRGQAHRLGRWLLYTEQYETELVNYRCSFDHMNVTPGMIVEVHDTHYAGAEFAGRMVSAVVDSSEHQITLDREIVLAPATTYTLGVTLPDGTVEYQDITTGDGTVSVVNVPQYTQLPAANAMWGVSSSVLEPRQFRVLNIEEVEPNVYDVTALLHYSEKYDLIEAGTVFDIPSATVISYAPPDAVSNIVVTERIALISDIAMAIIGLSWTAPADTRDLSYIVEYRLQPADPDDEEDVWTQFESVVVLENHIDIFDVEPGLYEFKVTTLGYAHDTHVKSPVTIVNDFTIVGKSRPPSVVTGLSDSLTGAGIRLDWDAVSAPSDLDISHYEIRINGDDWDDATLVGKSDTTFFHHESVVSGDTIFRVKAIDTSGNESFISDDITYTHTVPDVENFDSVITSAGISLTWDDVSFIFLDHYEIQFGGTSWDTGTTLLAKVKATDYLIEVPSSGVVTYRIKAIDLAGNESVLEVTREHDNVVPNVTNDDPEVLTVLTVNGAKITWNPISVTAFRFLKHYEVRENGTGWADADLLAIVNGTEVFDPDVTEGAQTYRIKAIDFADNESATELDIVYTHTVPLVENVRVTLTPSAVRIEWDEIAASAFPYVKHYEVRRGADWDDGTVLAQIKTTRFLDEFPISGDNRYMVKVIDQDDNFNPAEPTTGEIETQSIVTPDVTSMGVGQNDNVVLIEWPDVAYVALSGYTIKYNEQGVGDWDSGILITEADKTTSQTTASIPPGDWTIHIKAISVWGYESVNDITGDFTVTNTNVIVEQRTQEPLWENTRVNFTAPHYTGRLPIDDQTSAAADNDDCFDTYCQNPYPTSVYTTEIVTLAAVIQGRTYFTADVRLHPDEASGSAKFFVEVNIDDGGGTFAGWENLVTVQTRTIKRIQWRITLQNTLGECVLYTFEPVIDLPVINDGDTDVVIGDTGTTIVFNKNFPTAPRLILTYTGDFARSATFNNRTAEQFDAHVFDSDGLEVGGDVDWAAIYDG